MHLKINDNKSYSMVRQGMVNMQQIKPIVYCILIKKKLSNFQLNIVFLNYLKCYYYFCFSMKYLGMPAAIGNFHATIQTKWHTNMDLPCITSGVPNPNVKWTFNSQPIDLQSQRSIYDNYTLHLESVTSLDTGNYTCTAWNVYGSENVTTSLLVVGK